MSHNLDRQHEQHSRIVLRSRERYRMQTLIVVHHYFLLLAHPNSAKKPPPPAPLALAAPSFLMLGVLLSAGVCSTDFAFSLLSDMLLKSLLFCAHSRSCWSSMPNPDSDPSRGFSSHCFKSSVVFSSALLAFILFQVESILSVIHQRSPSNKYWGSNLLTILCNDFPQLPQYPRFFQELLRRCSLRVWVF